jgi:hypothetical protein
MLAIIYSMLAALHSMLAVVHSMLAVVHSMLAALHSMLAVIHSMLAVVHSMLGQGAVSVISAPVVGSLPPAAAFGSAVRETDSAISAADSAAGRNALASFRGRVRSAFLWGQ